MQTTVTSLQQPTLRASKHSFRPSLTIQLARPPQPCTGRSYSIAPQAFVRGNCGVPFMAGRANQQILEQMLREVAGIHSGFNPVAAKDCELPLAVDASDESDAYQYYADIPGVRRQDLKVQIKDGKLTITGKRDRNSQPAGAAEDKKQRFERRFGKFSRQIRLPEDADGSSIKAKVDNGVLTVRVGKLDKLPGVADIQVDF